MVLMVLAVVLVVVHSTSPILVSAVLVLLVAAKSAKMKRQTSLSFLALRSQCVGKDESSSE